MNQYLKNTKDTLSKIMKFLLMTIGMIFLLLGLSQSIRVIFEDELELRSIKKDDEFISNVRIYELAGYKFKIPGAYFDPLRQSRTRKVRALRLEGKMPNLSARKSSPDYHVNNVDPNKIDFSIYKVSPSSSLNPMNEFVTVSDDANSRIVLDNGWIRYKDDGGLRSEAYTYYKDLGAPTASRMRCDHRLTIPNPSCGVKYMLNDELEVNIRFRISREFDWEDIEQKVRSRINEFMINAEVQ